MAQVSSGSFVTNASQNRSLTFRWSVIDTSIAENYKEIAWSLVGSGSASGYIMAGDFEVVIEKDTVYASSTRIELRNGTVVASGKKKLYHDNNGNKIFGASVKASIYEFAVDNTGSGTWELPTIPRYASITKFDLVAISETEIAFDWNASLPCDKVWYAINDGSWVEGVYPRTTINGLSYLTTYRVKICVRARDSQLETVSENKSVTTYDIPYCTSTPNFTIGDALTLDFYNPLGRRIVVEGYSKTDGRKIFSGSTSGTRLVGFNDSDSMSLQYASIPNSQSDRYTVKTIWNDYSWIADRGGTYRIRGDEFPTINTFDYEDGNEEVYSITDNPKHIVQNKSKLMAIFDATPNCHADSIAEYRIECNGKTKTVGTSGTHEVGVVDSERDVQLALTAIDSRGLSASRTIDVTVIEHSDPHAVVFLKRINNYKDETELKVDGSISSVNGKNAIDSILYRYKLSGGEYGDFEPIGNGEKKTIPLDKKNAYIFNIVVEDSFGAKFDKEFVLGKGTFPLFIDIKKNSVGVNCFPKNENSLEVNGLDVSTIYAFSTELQLEAGEWIDTGIQLDNLLETGTYIMEVFLNGNTENGQYFERLSGIVAWYAESTNGGYTTDDIPLSKAGHSRGSHNIQLRVLRMPYDEGGMLKLQMTDSISWSDNSVVEFKFKRLL